MHSLEVTPLHRRGLQEKSTKIKMCTFFIWCQFLVFAKTNCMSLFNFNITLSVRPYFCRLARHGTGDAKRFKLKPRSLQFAPEMHSFSTTMSTKNTLNEIFSKLFCIWRLRTESNLLCPKMQKDGMTSDQDQLLCRRTVIEFGNNRRIFQMCDLC